LLREPGYTKRDGGQAEKRTDEHILRHECSLFAALQMKLKILYYRTKITLIFVTKSQPSVLYKGQYTVWTKYIPVILKQAASIAVAIVI